jgi:uncharacterized protein YjbI with pentapeptide repeats
MRPDLKFYHFIALTALATPLLLAAPMRAENPEHIKQLRETNRCPGCDLSRVELTGTMVIEADLSGANLQGANLSATDLREVFLEGSNLTQANLSVDLNNSNLIGVIGLPASNNHVPAKPEISNFQEREEVRSTRGVQFNPPDINSGGGREPAGTR